VPASDAPPTVCHHCGKVFGPDTTRISADVLVPDAGKQRIYIHEACIPLDRFLPYFWENLTIERIRA
jgi:hypothetical protein